jgi:hypothetical protein
MASNSSNKNRRRRESRRATNKSFRQAEKNSIQGPIQGAKGSYTDRRKQTQLPLADDLPSTGNKKKPRKRKAKQKCPANRTHEWYKEEVTSHQTWPLPWADTVWHISTTKRVWTCIHCFTSKSKVIATRDRYD